MNLLVWILAGGLLGSMFGLIFGGSNQGIINNVTTGILSCLGIGLLSAQIIADTPIADLKNNTFSPGALFLAVLGTLVSLVIFNLVF